MKRLLLGVIGSCFALLLAGSAGAEVFTLDGSISHDFDPFNDTVIRFDAVEDVDIPSLSASICFSTGTTCTGNFGTQDWIVFRATVESGEVNSFSMLPAAQEGGGPTATDYGYFNVGDALTYAEGLLPSEWDVDNPAPDAGKFTFTGGPTDTTEVLFALFELGTLPQTPACFSLPFPPYEVCPPEGTITFMIAAGAASQSIEGQLRLIPEPSTALLVGIGSIILGVRSRRRGA